MRTGRPQREVRRRLLFHELRLENELPELLQRRLDLPPCHLRPPTGQPARQIDADAVSGEPASACRFGRTVLPGAVRSGFA